MIEKKNLGQNKVGSSLPSSTSLLFQLVTVMWQLFLFSSSIFLGNAL